MFFSTVFDSIVGKFRGGSKNSIIIKSTGKGNDGQSKAAFGPGIEINPGAGERVLIERVDGSDSYLVSIAGLSSNVAPDTLKGERRFFSVDSNGDLSAYIKLKNGGTIELNGNDNFAVLYNELLIEFNELKTKFNTHVGNYNGHTHGSMPAPVPPSSTSAADITNTKSDKVLLPSNT